MFQHKLFANCKIAFLASALFCCLPLERIQKHLALGIRSLMRVPVRLRGETIGALLFFSREPRRFNALEADRKAVQMETEALN